MTVTMGPSERERNRRALTSPEPSAASSRSTERLKGLTGFRVEWDDGVFGKVEGIAFFVRTVGFGTARQKLELLPLDEVAAILPEERRILARTRIPPTRAFAGALWRVLGRGVARLVRRRHR